MRVRLILGLFCIIAAIIACDCSPTVDLICSQQGGENAVGKCFENVTKYCPPPANPADVKQQQEYEACRIYVVGHGAPPPWQTKNIVSSQKSVGPNCAVFKLTSPLDGMANGVNTFYWDPLPKATSYRISLFDGDKPLAQFDAAAPATNLQADVSTGAIGGSYVLRVRAQAFINGSPKCTFDYTIPRAALPGNPPQGNAQTFVQPAPTPIPTLPPVP
jgi:hypothetical protein